MGSPGPWVGKSLWVLVSGFGLLKKCRLSTGKSGGAFQIGVNTHKQSFEGKAEREVLVTMMSMHVLCTAVYSCVQLYTDVSKSACNAVEYRCVFTVFLPFLHLGMFFKPQATSPLCECSHR